MAICKGSAQICALRVSRLDASCGCVTGPNNAVATSAIIRTGSSPVYSPGEDFEMKNGCGDICLSLKDCDRLKRMDLTMEICTRDIELIELLTGASIYTYDYGDGSVVGGFSRRGIGAACPTPVSMEVWTKAIDNTGACDAAGATIPNYWRTIWPRATFTLGDVAYANEIATISLTGYAEANPRFGTGCFEDTLTGVTLDPDSPEHTFLDPAGLPTLACGYIDVPVPAEAV